VSTNKSSDNPDIISGTDPAAGGSVPGHQLTSAVAGLPAGERVLNVPEVAELLGVVVTRVMDDLNSHRLVAVQVDGVRQIPARFFTDGGEVNRFIPGLIALLSDGGYTDEEILEFLFTEDESLPGRPVDAVHGHLAREVMRRAQAMAIS
jgi:hypothetical protein